MLNPEFATKFGRLVQKTRRPTNGLMNLFPLEPDGIFSGEVVEYDITKSLEAMALPVRRGGPPRINTADRFITREFRPPYYSEERPFNIADFAARGAGMTKYDAGDMNKTQALMLKIATDFGRMQDKIDRGIEWQAAEILQKGKIQFSVFAAVLGDSVQDLDFEMSADLFPQAVASWAGASDKFADLAALANKIREKGLVDPDNIIFGKAAFRYFMGDDDVRAELDNRRVEKGMIEPSPIAGNGMKRLGRFIIDEYEYTLWLYTGKYNDPVTGNLVPYINDNNVVMFASAADRRRYHAGVDVVVQAEAEIMSLLPGRVTTIATRQAMDFMPTARTEGKSTIIGIDSAPLLVPTNNGGHGCLEAIF